MRLSNVVVGFDFSPAVERAADWVRRYLAPQARLTLVHSVELEPMPSYLGARFRSKSEWIEDEVARADERLRATAAEHGLAAAAVVVRAEQPHALLRTWIGETHADLLIIGAHREPGRSWRRIGSTTERLLREAETSMLVARGTMPDAPRNILVAVDDAGVTPTLLDWAVTMRRQFDARLLAVHVLSNAAFSHLASIDAARAPGESAARLQILEDVRAEARRWLDKAVAAAGSGEQIDVVIPHGVPADEILAAATSFGADLILIGRYGLGRVLPAVLGSVVGSVVHGAACPVLVVSDRKL